MTSNNFLKKLEYFLKLVKCNLQSVLPIVDNYASHFFKCLWVEICYEIIMSCHYEMSFVEPIALLFPHIHRINCNFLIVLFGLFKTFFNHAADSWMLTHHGQTLTIYDLPLIYLKSWDRTVNPLYIKSEFRCTSINPLDRNIFSE